MSPEMEDARRVWFGRIRARRDTPGTVLPPQPKLAHAVFRGKTAWVGNLADFPPDYALPLLRGFDAIAVKVAHGLEPIPFTGEQRRWLVEYGTTTRLLSWSWVTADDPVAQGHLHASVSIPTGHWCNGEKVLAYTAADGAPDPVAFGRSREWLRGFRAVLPDAPLAISPEPREDLDHQAWQNAGAAYGPQAYTENGHTIPDVVEYATAHGWQPGQIVPLIEPRALGRETPISGYLEDATRLGVAGVALYPADGLLDRPDIFQAVARWHP